MISFVNFVRKPVDIVFKNQKEPIGIVGIFSRKPINIVRGFCKEAD